MNNVNILGRLATDVEVIVKDDFKVAKFNLAYTKKLSQDKQETLFIGCVAFNGLADVVKQYFKKGDRILISAELKQEAYTDSQGNAKSTYKLRINNIDFIEKKENNTQGGYAPQQEKQAYKKQKAQANREPVDMGVEFAGEELPF